MTRGLHPEGDADIRLARDAPGGPGLLSPSPRRGPVLLLDLDNTLIDRDAAFRGAVAGFLADHGLAATDVDWMMDVDASGYTPRDDVASAFLARFGRQVPERAVRTLLDTGAADRVVLAPGTAQALRRLRKTGWRCVIVTNGRVAQQEAKIHRTGLDRLVDGWVISEAVGCLKPDPAIFRTAAAGAPMRDCWIIGDSARADIGGGAALGMTSVWVSAGRPWTEIACRPDHIAADIVTALGLPAWPRCPPPAA